MSRFPACSARFTVLAATLLCATAPVHAQGPLTNAITYQGELGDAGLPAAGTFDLRFRLYSAPTGGSPLGSTLCVNDLAITDGTFTVSLDFGAGAFAGSQRYLEVDVRTDTGATCATTTGYTTLTPRQNLTAAPHSLFALNASTFNGQAPAFYTSATNLTTGTLADGRLSANVPLLNSINAFSARQSITTSSAADANGLLVTQNNNNTSQAIRGVTTGATATVHAGFFEATNSTSGVGVQGQALAATGATRGVWGRVNSSAGWAGYFEGRGFFSQDVGIGATATAPEAPLHILEGSAGTVTASASASAVFERNSTNYVQILTPDASEKGLMLGSPTNAAQAGVYYTHGQDMNFRTGGNAARMRITDGGDIGVNISVPLARLHVGGVVRAENGFQFPDGRTQAISALDPGDTGIHSGYPAGTTVAITLNGASFPTARLVGACRLSRNVGGGNYTWAARPTLRRPRTTDNTWYNYVRLGTALSGLTITVNVPSGGTVTYTFPGGNAYSYRCITGDDGLPFEEVSYACGNVAGGFPTNPSVTAGTITGVTTPTVLPRIGESTGSTGLYRLVVGGTIEPNVAVVGNPEFSAPIDVTTGNRAGAVTTAIYTVRTNALGASRNVDSWVLTGLVQTTRLIIDTAADVNVLNDGSTVGVSWGLRIGDDGIPFEEAEFTLPMN